MRLTLNLFRAASVAALVLVVAPTFADDARWPALNVRLYKHFSLADFGAQSGNTCWGYVSESGREYAIMGLNNKAAFVEVTDPENPKIVATVPHTPSMWADIKVYKNACYLVTEAAGSGIQVMDLSKIDEGKVELVRTIMSPGRSHTIAVDADSGFLYTCGSRDGTGTTMAFDLKDPLNPVQVGAKTMTPVYQHEAQVFTYHEGKYAGKQILFGGGEGRGLELWDVTDKDKPTLVRRVSYPFVGYCHQGWLSADRRYFYVNDEFDESTNKIATRTLIFDVSNLETAELVGTYTTGKPSVDHNLYIRNDFIFHANYTTGLWVFDANDNPLEPVMKGYFDTYPKNDTAEFNGAWSNYPLLPSGVVIISDINDGMFIVDTSEATKTVVPVSSHKVVTGKAGSTDVTADKGKIVIEYEGTSKWKDLSKMNFIAADAGSGVKTSVEFYDWSAKKFVVVQAEGVAAMADYKLADTFVNPENKSVKARVTYSGKGGFKATLAEPTWTINP
ncbi:MAG: choice-of-anchor B family protein [Fimbriimonadaceae bacterium]|nr:choice-of-anchor B family protein [Fimbriimonadaceae bacterium]QYK58428.1 MAG: choice-of-anchor B family protein [Fimbriimonadaceae bacterium]